MSLLIVKNALLNGKAVDVYVENGRIAAVGDHGADVMPRADVHDAHSEDAMGKKLFPSFIDAHVHLRDPGFEWKEDIASGLAAAAHGGFGAVMCMPNTDPVNDDPAITRSMIEKAEKAWPHGPRVYPIGALSTGLRGEGLAAFGDLAEAGCVAFSNDGVPVGDTELFRRAMEYAADFGLRIIDHCEDPYLARKTVMNEGLASSRMGLKGQPDVGETIQVARSVLLAEYLDVPVHIAHVSCARSVDIIAWAKGRGVQVSAETCPHYLLLDESAVLGYNTNAKVNPPLRVQKDIDALRVAIKSGIVDILVTDHAPHAEHEKEHPFDLVPNGFTGMDTALATSWQLVREKVIDEADFVRLWCTKPGELFALPVNDFTVGAPANFFLFDPDVAWLMQKETIYSKSCNSPWLGKTLQGRVVAHWIGGVKIV